MRFETYDTVNSAIDIDTILSKQLNISAIDSIQEKMLDKGAEILKNELIKEAKKHEDTGEMVESIRINKKGFNFAVVAPSGTASGKSYKKATYKGRITTRQGKFYYDDGRRRALLNRDKLVFLEYGRANQSQTPVVEPAKIKAELKVIKAMQKIYESELKT